ncbi:BrnT family toxin [Sphingomonas sp. NFX23]|uniref:BrnT family toxin n=1 Tax=Sphingomonas sp. NFX23 TaxID=2819532 RepID=UPI003CEC9A69
MGRWKAASNLAKHGVSFELAREVWSDPLYVVLPDRMEGGEQLARYRHDQCCCRPGGRSQPSATG